MPRPRFHPEFGASLRELRKKHQWSIPEAARYATHRHKLPLSEHELTWLEQGRVKKPTPRVLRAVAAVYGVDGYRIVRDFLVTLYGLQVGIDPAKDSPPVPAGGVDVAASNSARVLAEKDLEQFDALSEAAATIVQITNELLARHGAEEIPRRQIADRRAHKPAPAQRPRKRRR